MIRNVCIAVQQKLLELHPHEIPYIAEDWGQLDFYDQRPPVNFPCALVDAAECEFADLSRKAQRGTGVLTVRIADNPPINFSASAPDSERQFDLLGLTERVYTHLQGFCGEGFSGLTRISLRKVKRDDSIKEYELRFRFGGVDNSAMNVTTKVERVKVEISTGIK